MARHKKPPCDMTRHSRLHLPILALCLLSPWYARAESPPRPYPVCQEEPSETQVSGAKGAYQAGTVSFQEADYMRAILYWEDAFRRDCTATKLLLNLARAYELAGRKEQAILALETFLERKPESSERASIDRRVRSLRESLDNERIAAAEEKAKNEPVAVLPPPVSKQRVRRRPVWPVALTAAGTAAGVTGLVLYLVADSTLGSVNCDAQSRDCSANPEAGTSAAEETARRDSAEDQKTAGAIVGIAGGALAVGGGIAWYVLWKDRPEIARSMLPVVMPGRVGLSFQGTF